MKTTKIFTFAALAVPLLFQTPTTHARDKGKAVPPSDPFTILGKAQADSDSGMAA